MQITTELGQKIISRLAEYIDVDINIMDLNGKIVASTDKTRISERHTGALEVIKSNDDLILNHENVQAYPGTKPGVNLPIMHQHKITGVVGVSGNPNDILRITGLIRVSVEIVIDQIYIQQQAYYKERQWNNWLHQLLHPSGYDDEKLREEAAYSLKVNTEFHWRVILLKGMDVQTYLNDIRREIAASNIKTLFTLPFLQDELITALDLDFDVIQRLAERLSKLGFLIGVGDIMFGIDGIRQSYQQAKQALQFDGGRNKIIYSEDWEIERLSASISDDVFNHICLEHQHRLETLGGDYLKTVDVYFEMNFSIKETASILHIHRNTLLYRLEQIKDKVGLDPRNFQDAFLLKVVRSRPKI
ncbi:CdaR family transcriptional regulator [Lentibacillus salinarum]|uniref:CdaR family transcriptional regulator n=1 Tax=Lentibacillus salinarum TaxID=446820 RepID=A0ABW3ZUP4_9BACI